VCEEIGTRMIFGVGRGGKVQSSSWLLESFAKWWKGEGENLKQIDDALKLKSEILRHLMIVKRIRTADEIKREKELQEKLRQEKEDELNDMERKNKDRVKRDGVRKTARRPVEKAPEAKVEAVPAVAPTEIKVEAKKKAEKVSMEDIDKKIDEILTEEIL